MARVYLFGASGHGKVIKEIVESNGDSVTAFIDDDSRKKEKYWIKLQSMQLSFLLFLI